MEIRSLKQVLHWLFLIIGTVSLLLLPYSVMTYLDLVREGYGIEATVDEAWLRDDVLFLRLRLRNPGGIDLELGPVGNISMVGFSSSSLPRENIPADGITEVIISFPLQGPDLMSVRSTGSADFSMNLALTVRERDVVVNLHVVVKGQEVRV